MIQLEKLVEKNLPKEKEGKVASYIPTLAEVNPKQLGVAEPYNIKKYTENCG